MNTEQNGAYQVSINNPSQIMSHVLLGSFEICDKVASTKEWKDGQKMNLFVSVNGIEIGGDVFEQELKKLIDRVEESFKVKYDAARLDELVEERAKELLKEYADNALEAIYNLTNKLQEAEDLLVPYWQRKKEVV